MMVAWYILDGSGAYAASAGASPTLPSGAAAIPTGLTIADILASTLVAGTWVARPVAPVAAMVSGAITLTGCPSGSYAEVTDDLASEFLGRIDEASGTILITLPDPGRYVIDVVFPLPYLPSRSIVTVV
jgi:hypothetical protein